MAGKNDPSIYDDRSNIGSSDELDEYGVWVKSEPQDISSSVPDMEELPDFDDGFADNLDLPDFSDIPDIPEPQALSPADEIIENETITDETITDEIDETIDNTTFANETIEFEEVPEDSDLPKGSDPDSIDKDGFTEVSMNDFLDSDGASLDESIDFGNLDSIDTPEPVADEPPRAEAPAVSADSSLSNQLLMKIADELSSIKTELASLKRELAAVKTVEPESGGDAHAGGGFFDEEDDEKIALTGDELDNILNTANFTEEAGSDAGESLSEEIPLENIIDGSPETNDDLSFDDVDLDELDSAVKIEDSAKAPLFTELEDDFDVSLDLSDGLESLREDGAAPMTEITEDTSYLEEDPLAQEQEIDLSNAVIDEPDLGGITENPIKEPSIDNISIDMDMEEQTAIEPGNSDDFVFETEEMMEIPSTEIPVADDALPLAAADDFTVQETDDFAEPAADSLTPQPDEIPSNLKQELKTVLSYMDQLLESLPEDKIEEFAKSEYFDTYKKLFEELGLV